MRSGIGVPSILGIVFIVLKLGGWSAVANWSWVWVLAPFWIPVAGTIALLLVWALLAAFSHWDKRNKEKKRLANK